MHFVFIFCKFTVFVLAVYLTSHRISDLSLIVKATVNEVMFRGSNLSVVSRICESLDNLIAGHFIAI